MIDQPTTLILGAGASIDFKYPSGAQLTQDVLKITNETNTDAYRCIRALGYSDQQVIEFKDALRMSGRSSVDAFLEYRPELVNIGKVAMTLALVRREAITSLFYSTDHWYSYLFSRMDAPFEKFSKNQISFITFNYDRTLEVYLFTALKNAYGKKDREVAEVIKNIQIIHVHGKLGNLPWEDEHGRKYENTFDESLIRSSANGIKIISESSKGDEEFGEARNLLRTGRRLIFLGFGYHDANLQRLDVGAIQAFSIHGSCFGLTQLECSEITKKFKPTKLQLGASNLKVLEFLREHVSL